MSRNHFNELSPCEALIMKLIWEAPQDIPVLRHTATYRLSSGTNPAQIAGADTRAADNFCPTAFPIQSAS